MRVRQPLARKLPLARQAIGANATIKISDVDFSWQTARLGCDKDMIPGQDRAAEAGSFSRISPIGLSLRLGSAMQGTLSISGTAQSFPL
jgi:hypothetical protein